MKIFDGHMHLTGSTAPNPEGLLERLSLCGVSGGGLFSIDPDDGNFTYRQRMDNLFSWVKGYEDRLFPVAWLHPYEDDVLDKVRDCAERGVVAFKFIPNNYFVSDEKATAVFRLIEELGLPIMFHSGILYDFLESSKFNKPLNWECFANYRNLRFSLAHCSHPWYDECLLVFGKFRWIANHAMRAANGEPTIYREHPWIKAHMEAGKCNVPQMYLDTTPGAHHVFRRDLFTKLCADDPEGDRVFFGSDQCAEDYNVKQVSGYLALEKEILDAAGADEAFRQKMYCDNLFAFLGKETPCEA